MRVLLTNDDGIHAEGLAVAERVLRQLTDDIWVVAPETDQSGLAHSLTLNEPLRLREIDERHFALKGTPTDCVIMGVRELMPQAPDLIVSGVNSGQNAADDITYSGTVAGAMEGAMMGAPSIALSQAYEFSDGKRVVLWQTAEAYGPRIIRRLMETPFPNKTFVNVNFPNCPPEDVKSVEITRQGAYTPHGLHMEERQDGRGFPYYWLRFGRNKPEDRKGSDLAALSENRISITPLKLDLTHEDFREDLITIFDDAK
jgi:5'/3'-nucleotidase